MYAGSQIHSSIQLLCAGDSIYVQRLFRFLEDNLEFQRLYRNVGVPSMDWNPEGLASPRRYDVLAWASCSGVKLPWPAEFCLQKGQSSFLTRRGNLGPPKEQPWLEFFLN
eukprot:1159778-Pelagomonas_calceolata.AAC.18